MDDKLYPVEIKLLQKQRTVTIGYANGEKYQLSCEYLRVFSPSAELKVPGDELARKLILHKQAVNIIAIESVGHYAVKLVFDDGHDTGLYSWETLYDLAVNYPVYWQSYLDRCSQVVSSQEENDT